MSFSLYKAQKLRCAGSCNQSVRLMVKLPYTGVCF